MSYLIALLLMLISCYLFFSRKAKIGLTNRRVIISPAEGYVAQVIYQKKLCTITIVMNLFNIHRQYLPYYGKVEKIKKQSGEFNFIFTDKVKKTITKNSCVLTVVTTEFGWIYQLGQYSGKFASRIVNNLQEGSVYSIGQEAGMIKLGSLVTLTLPADKVKIVIKQGCKIKIGDPIAKIKSLN